MSPYSSRHRVTFSRRAREGFRLETTDVEESFGWTPFGWARASRRGLFSRYITAGGTRDTQHASEEGATDRSWRRLAWAIVGVSVLWLLGFFL